MNDIHIIYTNENRSVISVDKYVIHYAAYLVADVTDYEFDGTLPVIFFICDKNTHMIIINNNKCFNGIINRMTANQIKNKVVDAEDRYYAVFPIDMGDLEKEKIIW